MSFAWICFPVNYCQGYIWAGRAGIVGIKSIHCLLITPFTPIGCLLANKKGAGGGEKRIRVVKAERKRSFTCVSVNTASKQGAWEQKRRDRVISLSTADVVAPRVLHTGKVSLSLSRPSRMSHEAQNTIFIYFIFFDVVLTKSDLGFTGSWKKWKVW